MKRSAKRPNKGGKKVVPVYANASCKLMIRAEFFVPNRLGVSWSIVGKIAAEPNPVKTKPIAAKLPIPTAKKTTPNSSNSTLKYKSFLLDKKKVKKPAAKRPIVKLA